MKLLIENFRNFINEQLAATAIRPGKKISKADVMKKQELARLSGTVSKLVQSILPIAREEIERDPETFDRVNIPQVSDEELNLKIKKVLLTYSEYMKQDTSEDDDSATHRFMAFVVDLPDKFQRPIIKSLLVNIGDYTSGNILSVTASNEIKLFACLATTGTKPSEIKDDDLNQCRRDTGVKIEQKNQKILKKKI